MHWPFRRRTSEAPGPSRPASPARASTARASLETFSTGPTELHSGENVSQMVHGGGVGGGGRGGAAADGGGGGEAGARSRPRVDWARVGAAPIVTPRAAPLTFHGDEFGRSVAGARSLTHRATAGGPAIATAGVLLDVARLETVTAPSTEAPAPTLSVPSVLPPPPVIRHLPARHERRTERGVAAPDLDGFEVGFAPAPPVAAAPTPEPVEPVESISWSADTGFSTPQPATRPGMRLVGQRGSMADVLAASHPDSIDAPLPDAGEDRGETDEQPGPSAGDPSSGEPAVRYLPARGPRIERAPSHIADIVERATGVSVGDALIDRTPDTTRHAAALGAIAFAKDGVVHLPAELGSLDDARTRSVAAHELTHVAQQRAAGGRLPDEDSPEGNALEQQARAVQHAVAAGTVVAPTFLRRAPDHAGTSGSGVQRLADTGDAYAWQERGDPPSLTHGRDLAGMFLGRTFDRSPGEERQQELADRAWSEQFEQAHAATLQHRRDERYAELREDAERELRIRARRGDLPDDRTAAINDDDIRALQQRLDDEMPYEYGPPEGIEPYPEQPEHPEPDDGLDRPVDPTPRGRAGRPPARRVAAAPSAGAIGRSSAGRGGSLVHSSGRRGAGADSGDDEQRFDWQERPNTDRENLTSIFGGGIGGLLGRLVSGSEEDAETASEARVLPQLHHRRRQRETELREDALHSKRLAALQARADVEAVGLTDDELLAIRVSLDEEMPLEEAMPEYLPDDELVSISLDDGTFGGPIPEPPPDEQPSGDAQDRAEGGPPTGRPAAAGGLATVASPRPDTDAAGDQRRERAAGTGAVLGTADRTDEDDDEAFTLGDATDQELDELARKLYGRMRRQLRHELLIDRERAGVLADVR